MKTQCLGKDHHYNPITLDGACVECGGLDPMEREARHTPTPWKVSQTGKFVMHSKPGTVLNVCEASKEDAAFIVRAINAHEELLEKLRILTYSGQYKSTVISEAFLDSCVQAIAKAEVSK